MTGKICVNVEFFASLRAESGKDGWKITLAKGSSLENLFDALKEKYPAAFTASMKEHVFVLNGRKADPHKIIELKDNDKVDIFPLVGGG